STHDWSSDVCSSDLATDGRPLAGGAIAGVRRRRGRRRGGRRCRPRAPPLRGTPPPPGGGLMARPERERGAAQAWIELVGSDPERSEERRVGEESRRG